MKELKDAETCDVDKVLTQIMSYRRELAQVERLEEGKEADYCSDILSSVVAAYRPLSLRELGILSGLPWDLANDDKFVARLVHMCGPLLDIREGIVHLIHQSARDFLVEEQNWWTESRDLDQLEGESGTWKVTSRPPRHIHVKFAERSIEVISRELRRNMFNLPVLGASIKDYSPPSLPSLGDIEYYMLHWSDHLSDAWDDDRDRRLRPRYRHDWTTLQLHYDDDPTPWIKRQYVTPFLNQLFLYWLETLCATGNLVVGVAATAKLSRVFELGHTYAFQDPDRRADADIKKLVLDANRLLRYFSPCIGTYPSQLYYAGLVFAPSTSSMRRQFSKERPPWITTNPAVDANWNVPPQIIEGLDGPVLFNTSFSRIHGIATISEGGIVRLWDRDSGMMLHTLNTRTQNVLSADFFDYVLLVASSDGTVQVWDARSGRLLRSIQANPSSVSSAAFSPSWPRMLRSGWHCWLALGCYDGAVRLYEGEGNIGDVSSLKLHRTFSTDGGSVRSLAISHDHLVCVSSNHSIRVWGVWKGAQKHAITGHTGCRFSETCSPLSVTVTNEHLAAGLSDGTVRLWHIGSGEPWHTLQGHEGPVLSVNFSRAGQRLASGSADKTVRLWNCTLGTLLHTFVGHSGSVLSVRVLSADGRLILSSASKDGTVRIWDTAFNPSPMNSDDRSRSSTSSTTELEGTQAATMCETDLAGPIGQLSITGGLADASNAVGIGESCKSKGWNFSSDRCWIMWKEHKILWVPPDYRPVAFSREPNGLTFRCASGRTLTIGFSTDAGKSVEELQW
ncbi:hypothetical protein NW767_006707 [Fusarium falciforme]|nr:hypothetical protein NW767_006707 [Fusarium falciforme]